MSSRPPQAPRPRPAPRRRAAPPPTRRPAAPAARRDRRRDGRTPWWRRPVALLLVLPGVLLGFAAVVLFFYFFTAVPLPDAVGQDATVILDQAGREVATLQPEASRQDVELGALPEHVRHAVLAAEDASFYDHAGISLPGIFRAAFVNLTSGGITQGGSTISQQYVKNVTDQREQTALRKIREAALAVKLERQLSKDDILKHYLNTIYFGRGAYGIEAAAEAYFGKDAAELSVGEAAQLAGIIPAPSALDPVENPEGAERRYRYVLRRMVANDWLDPAEAGRLAAQRPAALEPRQVQFKTAPFFLNLVKDELAARLGEQQVYTGLRVTTTLDVGIQEVAERRFREAFASVQPTGALVSLDPATGGVRALVSGKPGEQLNLATQVRRQPGSTFKPFALAAWVEQGRSPESWFQAPPSMTFTEGVKTPWEVGNYGGQGFEGGLTLREATWRSVNTVYAQLMFAVGADAVADLAERAGVQSPLGRHPSLVLGTSEVTPLELATAYNTLATGGIRRRPFTVLKVERADEVLFEARPRGDRAFSEQVAWTVTDVLRGVLEQGTGRAADLGRPAAGKTGTTQNSADAWFAGYTPHLTTVVWMGNRDSNAAMPGRPTGGGLPAKLWGAFMREVLRGVPARSFPEPQGALTVTTPAPPTPESDAECPPGQVPVTAEGSEGGETDPLQQVCAPADGASPTPQPSDGATPTPTASPSQPSSPDEQSEQPEPSDSGTPSPTPSPTPATPAAGTPTPSPSGRRRLP